jgi:protein SCO1/2
MQTKKIILPAALAVIALVLGFGAAVTFFDSGSGQQQAAPEGLQGYMVSPARKIAVPDLIKGNGASFTGKDIKGSWTAMFFGYTNCPDICPTTMAMLVQAKKKAAEQGVNFPQVVFVSVDPERDNVEMLGEYVEYFDKDFTGVTGDAKLIDALARQMSVVYMRVPSVTDDPNNYHVDHSAAILLLSPEGKLTAFLTAPHTPAGIVDSIQAVVRHTPPA